MSTWQLICPLCNSKITIRRGRADCPECEYRATVEGLPDPMERLGEAHFQAVQRELERDGRDERAVEKIDADAH